MLIFKSIAHGHYSKARTMKNWFTALEIATLTISDWPKTERGVQLLAERQNWERRKRKGIGGGYEYHIGNLPISARDDIFEQAIASMSMHETHVVNVDDISLPEARNALDNLTDWQRSVMDARLVILNFIERETYGVSKEVIIRNLVKQSQTAKPKAEPSAKSWNNFFNLCINANAKSGLKKQPGTFRLSRRTIFRWISAYKNHGVIGLAPGLPAHKDFSIPEWVPGLLAVYCRPSKPSLAASLEDYTQSLSDPGKAPTYDQANRFLKKLSVVALNKGRMGTQELKRYKAFTRRDVSELWPTACYTADGHSFKATVLHPFHGQPFKPELTAVLDVYTGYLSGWHAGLSENALDVMYALSDAVLEREDGRHRGIGSLFYTDNGPGFKNKLMNAPSTGFCERWGMMSVNSLPYNSQARGMIEVLNKNLWIRAAKKLDSYCGKDADKEARRALKKKTNKELRAYRTPSLHMAWKDFLGFIQEEVDAYNNRPHRRMPKTRDHQTLKMRHMTPKEMWTQSLREGLIEPYIIPEEHAAELHRPYEKRKVSRCEVKLPMGRYFSRDLEAFHGKWVMVGYDIHDNSKVWVRDFDMRLLAVADLDGNAVPYFPIQTVTDVAASQRELLERNEFSMTAAQLKQRKRAKNRLKTVQTRTHEIMEEYMGPPIEIERPQDEPFTLEQDARADAFLERMEQRSVPSESPRAITANGRPVFRDDFEWIQWLIDHRDQVTSYDLKQVKEKTGHKFFMERLADEGIDVGPLLEMAA